MVKGGYQIIDLEDRDLTPNKSTRYEGIYDKLEGTRKAILLSGITVDSVKYNDCFVTKIINGSYIELNVTFSRVESSGNMLHRGIVFRVQKGDLVNVKIYPET